MFDKHRKNENFISGAVHTVIFAGFSAEAIAARINDSKAKVVVTADEAVRGEESLKKETMAVIRIFARIFFYTSWIYVWSYVIFRNLLLNSDGMHLHGPQCCGS